MSVAGAAASVVSEVAVEGVGTQWKEFCISSINSSNSSTAVSVAGVAVAGILEAEVAVSAILVAGVAVAGVRFYSEE